MPFVIAVPALELAAQVSYAEGPSSYQIGPTANLAVGITLLHVLLVHDCLIGSFLPVDFPLSHQLLDVVLFLPEDVL